MTSILLTVGAAWVATGLALSIVMGRRGFDAFNWLLIGSITGPLGVVIAVGRLAQGRERSLKVLSPPRSRGGDIDVLEGFDGSPESRAAVETAFQLFGSALGRITVARAIPSDAGWTQESLALASLEEQRERFVPRGLGLELVRGRPDVALTELAGEAGYDVLVIGTRGAGASKRVLGSVAKALAGTTKFPVLLVGPGADSTRGTVDENNSANAA